MRNRIVPPKRWGDDELTKFLDSSRDNQFATFANKVSETTRIVDIDKGFRRILHGWINPSDLIAAFLMFRAHSAYRAAASCAFAGQSAELYPLLRIALEYGGYAILINRKPGLAEVWLNRGESDADRARVRSEFKVGNIRETLASSNASLERTFSELYERSIDLGAHPNELSVTTSLTIGERGKRNDYSQVYLHGDGIVLDHSLRSLAQVGICVLLIFQEIFPERFELLGVSYDLTKLRIGL